MMMITSTMTSMMTSEITEMKIARSAMILESSVPKLLREDRLDVATQHQLMPEILQQHQALWNAAQRLDWERMIAAM